MLVHISQDFYRTQSSLKVTEMFCTFAIFVTDMVVSSRFDDWGGGLGQ